MRGGKRKGSGRKLKYGEPTVTMRVPISLKEYIIKLIQSKANDKTRI